MTRILLYSDAPILAQGLASVLGNVDGFELLAPCHTLAAAMEQLTVERPEIAVLDLTPDLTFAALIEMRKALASCKVILWVNAISTELAYQAIGLGIRGILRKSLPAEDYVRCLSQVSAGELWLEKDLSNNMIQARRVSLTPREGELVTLLSQGLKNKELATALMITEGTVKVYLSRLFHKLGVKDRFELALLGLKNLSTGQLGGDEPNRPVMASVRLRSLVLEPSSQPLFRPSMRQQPWRPFLLH